MNQNALELTLLRAAAAPEMRADNQVHHFTYAFTAWEGDFAGCDVVKQGYELNEKPRLVLGCVPTFSIASVKNGTVVLDTIKPALDRSGDLILRLYESKKAAGKAQILLNLGRFDGENYNIGLFDICSRPYQDMASYVKQCSEAMYEIADGTKVPTDEKAESIPMIAY